jgi:hypothetical protein
MRAGLDFGIDPGFAVVPPEELAGSRITNNLFLLTVPLDTSPQVK